MSVGARALLDGCLAILPTDTVYGIAAAAGSQPGCEQLYRVKQRPASQPVAVIAGSVDGLLSVVLPDLDGLPAAAARALLPGPLTLVLPNPGRRFPQLCGERPDAIGVRIPVLAAEVAALASAVGGLAMTSANLRGQPAPAALDEVPQELLEVCALAVDGGRLPGSASAVIDLTGRLPAVLREGPGAAEALRMIAGL